MTGEEMERSIEFILEQQAKFTEDMQKLKEFGFELAKAQIRTQNEIATLAEFHKRLADAQKMTEERLSALIALMERRFGGNGQGQKTG